MNQWKLFLNILYNLLYKQKIDDDINENERHSTFF